MMKSLRSLSHVSQPSLIKTKFSKPVFNFPYTLRTPHHNLTQFAEPIFKTFTTITPTSPFSTEEENDDKFDWYSAWYAIMPVCDLDKRAPHGKKVMGLDVVVWWDKNDHAWHVFEDACPHRLAPLSQGRIDESGRLQCVYHGWCFAASGDCKLIPQAPLDAPPVHTFKKACVAVYPSTVQNGIVWFWPNTDPKYKDILDKTKPPYIPELDDPSLINHMFNRDIPYRYEILIENLMDPAHLPYAHYGILRTPQSRWGGPLEINVKNIDKNGFTANQQNEPWNFVAPFLFYGRMTMGGSPDKTKVFIYLTVIYYVSPGNSRLIIATARKFSLWIDPFVSRWMYHIGQNLVIDSDTYLLHVEEKKVMEADPSDWQKLCFTPTKSDANVVAFRKWLNKFAGGKVNWGKKYDGSLPPTPPREHLMDRYWTHVVNCSSCSAAYKALNVLEVSLQMFSVAAVAIVAATKPGLIISVALRNTLVVAVVLCFVGSKWLSRFIY